MEINTYFLNCAVPVHAKTTEITGLLAKWRGVCLVNLLRESTKAERFLSQRFNNPALKARRFPFGPKISIAIFFHLPKTPYRPQLVAPFREICYFRRGTFLFLQL